MRWRWVAAGRLTATRRSKRPVRKMAAAAVRRTRRTRTRRAASAGSAGQEAPRGQAATWEGCRSAAGL